MKSILVNIQYQTSLKIRSFLKRSLTVITGAVVLSGLIVLSPILHAVELEKEEKLNNFLNIFTRVIGQTHFGWVNRVKYKLRKDGSLYVYGLHYYNKEYSLYLKALFGNLLKHYEYKLVEDKCSLTNKTVILEFEPYKI